MSDFSDLWASSNPVKSQKPVSLSLGGSKSTSISRSATPDTFNLLASTTHYSSQPTSRSITPAIQKTSIPFSKSSSNNGDAFHGLVSLGSKASAEGNLTMAERAALAERERQQKAKEVNAALTSQASFWDQFENNTSQTRATSEAKSNSMGHGFLVEPLLSQQQATTSLNNRDPFWDLDSIVSESATSTVLSASENDKTSLTSSTMASQHSRADTLGKSKELSTLMSTDENWDDLIFGDSNKPVDIVKSLPEKVRYSLQVWNVFAEVYRLPLLQISIVYLMNEVFFNILHLPRLIYSVKLLKWGFQLIKLRLLWLRRQQALMWMRH